MGSLRFQRLPATAEEAREFGRILRLPEARILTGEAASEGAVKELRGPRILHLATLGFFLRDRVMEPVHPSDPRPRPPSLEDPLLRSGLALSGFNRWQETTSSDDGMLTALEVVGRT